MKGPKRDFGGPYDGLCGGRFGQCRYGLQLPKKWSYIHQLVTSNGPPKTSRSSGLCQVMEVNEETPAQANMQQHIALLSVPLNPKP